MRHTFGKLAAAFACALLMITLTASTTPAAPAAGEKVLLFTKTTSYRHDSIPAGIAMFQQMAADSGWQLTQTEDSSAFTDATLSTYDITLAGARNPTDPELPRASPETPSSAIVVPSALDALVRCGLVKATVNEIDPAVAAVRRMTMTWSGALAKTSRRCRTPPAM